MVVYKVLKAIQKLEIDPKTKKQQYLFYPVYEGDDHDTALSVARRTSEHCPAWPVTVTRIQTDKVAVFINGLKRCTHDGGE